MEENKVKRVKGKNFSPDEIVLLIDLIENYVQIIENKKTDGATVKQKNDAWEELTIKFNSMNNTKRTPAQLKTCYDNYKRKVRKENANEKAELYKTGGGSSKKSVDACGERLINLLKNQFQPDQNLFDSASIYHDRAVLKVVTENHLETDDNIIILHDSPNIYNNMNRFIATEIPDKEQAVVNMDDIVPVNQLAPIVDTPSREKHKADDSALAIEESSEVTPARKKMKSESKDFNLDKITEVDDNLENPKVEQTPIKIKNKPSAASVYSTLAQLSKTKNKNKEKETHYWELKLEFKRAQLQKLQNEIKHQEKRDKLEQEKLENEVLLQQIQIKQEDIKLKLLEKQLSKEA